MKHLTRDELLDIAEGPADARSPEHLAACEACRREIASLRRTLAAAAEVSVPEPSPLFWDHLSDRIHRAVAADMVPDGRWSAGWWSWRWVVTGGAVLVLALTVALRPGSVFNSSPASTTSAPPAAVEDIAFDDDEAMLALAELTADLDWDSAIEAGLSPPAGAADRAVAALSEDERLELQKILQEALSNSGA
jgi:hypothetical protein